MAATLVVALVAIGAFVSARVQRSNAIQARDDERKAKDLDDQTRSAVFSGLLKLARETPLGSFSAHTTAVHKLAFSPSGRFLATVSVECEAFVWDLRTAIPWPHFAESALPKPTLSLGTEITDIAFSPDGRFLAVGTTSGQLQLWRIQGDRFEPLSPQQGHMQQVATLAFSSDGDRCATGALDGVQVWDLTGGKPVEKAGSMFLLPE